jgi:hypothetical protein
MSSLFYLNKTKKILLQSTVEFKNGGAITPVNICCFGALLGRNKGKDKFLFKLKLTFILNF